MWCPDPGLATTKLRCVPQMEVSSRPWQRSATRGSPNKQLEPTVIRRRVRAASALLHYALAARWTARLAAAQLRREAANATR